MDYKEKETTLQNKKQEFTFTFFAAPENKQIRTILEASEIGLKIPNLKEQIRSEKLFVIS